MGTRIWMSSDKANKGIWDCVVYSFSNSQRKARLIENAEAVRYALIDLMQTNSAFESMSLKGTEARIDAFETTIREVLLPRSVQDTSRPVSMQQRRELIQNARATGLLCGICNQELGPLDELLHIHHTIPHARGGTSNLDNLQVVHKSCNMKKGARVEV